MWDALYIITEGQKHISTSTHTTGVKEVWGNKNWITNTNMLVQFVSQMSQVPWRTSTMQWTWVKDKVMQPVRHCVRGALSTSSRSEMKRPWLTSGRQPSWEVSLPKPRWCRWTLMLLSATRCWDRCLQSSGKEKKPCRDKRNLLHFHLNWSAEAFSKGGWIWVTLGCQKCPFARVTWEKPAGYIADYFPGLDDGCQLHLCHISFCRNCKGSQHKEIRCVNYVLLLNKDWCCIKSISCCIFFITVFIVFQASI